MKKVKKKVARLAGLVRGVLGELTSVGVKLAFRRQRYMHFLQLRNDEQELAKEARDKAHELRPDSPKKADRWVAKAHEHDARAARAEHKRIKQRGMVKRLNQKRKKLAVSAADLQAELKKAKADAGGKVKIGKNGSVQGGSPEERLRFAQIHSAVLCAQGKRRNDYSQSGSQSVNLCFKGEPYGYRSDCSQWFTSVYFICKLPNPNGGHYLEGAMYTGSLEDAGTEISRAEAMKTPGAGILFGPRGATHHIEMARGDGTTRTTGHGSDPIDEADFDVLPGEKHYYKFPTK